MRTNNQIEECTNTSRAVHQQPQRPQSHSNDMPLIIEIQLVDTTAAAADAVDDDDDGGVSSGSHL